MEIRNLKFHKIHKKSKTLVKTVFNGLIFERSDMVKTTVARTLSVDLDQSGAKGESFDLFQTKVTFR